MAINYTALRSEIMNDPSGLGYAPLRLAGNHSALADALNLVRASITGIFRGIIPTYELVACIVKGEYDVLAASDRTLLQIIVSAGQIDTADAGTRAIMATIFGAATTTRANMIARATRTGSRAEQLFGTGITVTVEDIGKALAL